MAIDILPVVRCKYCKYAPLNIGEECAPSAIVWPNESFFDDLDAECCPYNCGDPWYSIMPQPDWYCWKGKDKEVQENDQ